MADKVSEDVLEHMFNFISSNQDRNAISLVCKSWFKAERLSRKVVLIGNCYSLTPQRLISRFPNIRALRLKGKPNFYAVTCYRSDLVPHDWGGSVSPWIQAMAEVKLGLEELRLKRMVITDENLKVLSCSFPNLKSLVLIACHGFTKPGLAAIKANCRVLQEMEFLKKQVDNGTGQWSSHFADTCSSRVSVCSAYHRGDLVFGFLQRLKGWKSGCVQRLWIDDYLGDSIVKSIASCCKEMQELRIFKSRFARRGEELTDVGLVAISQGCPKLHTLVYQCQQMTNAALTTVARNLPNLRSFKLSIVGQNKPDHVTMKPFDDGFGEMVKSCKGLRKLSLSGLITDEVFLYIGMYGEQLEMLSVASGRECREGILFVLNGCTKLHKLKINDCSFGDDVLLTNVSKYESMQSIWISSCNVTLGGCKMLAKKMPRLSVEIMGKNLKEELQDDNMKVDQLYIYRTLDGPRKDTPNYVWTLEENCVTEPTSFLSSV